MCGRYSLTTPTEAMRQVLLFENLPNLEPRYNIAPTQDEALIEIYKRARPGAPPTIESARGYFRTAFFERRRYALSRVGRYKLNKKLGAEIDKLEEQFGLKLEKPKKDSSVLTPAEVLAACKWRS